MIDEPGTKHWAIAGFIQDKWQARPNVTVDLGLRWEYYNPLEGIEGKGTLANYDPATNTIQVAGYGSTTSARERQEELQELRRRAPACRGASTTSQSCAPGTASSAIPFPDNRYAFNFPVKQNYSGAVANGFQRAGIDGGRLPGAGVLGDSVGRHHPGERIAAQFDATTSSRPACTKATLQSWNVAFQRRAAVSPSRPTSPTSAIAASIS